MLCGPLFRRSDDGATATARRLKVLDDENRKLKKLLSGAMLDVATLREALGKNF